MTSPIFNVSYQTIARYKAKLLEMEKKFPTSEIIAIDREAVGEKSMPNWDTPDFTKVLSAYDTAIFQRELEKKRKKQFKVPRGMTFHKEPVR
jgi:predicted phosphohydrolase